MNSVMERWIGSCRPELLDRTLVWNQRHLMIVLREYEDFYNTHRPHRTLKQAAPLRPLPDGIADRAIPGHAPVPAADYGRHGRERDPRIDLQSANDSEVFGPELESIHAFHRSYFDDRRS
jgi:Integrase core domain